MFFINLLADLTSSDGIVRPITMLQEANVGLRKCDSEGGALASPPQLWPPAPPLATVVIPAEKLCWYAIHTRARHETKVSTQLQAKGVTTFLPQITQRHRWSDRYKTIQSALFSCYTFVQMNGRSEKRQVVLQTPGVVGLVGIHGEALPIPDKEIEDIQALLSRNLTCALYPFVKVGQRVRIRGGCLDGVAGVLVAKNSDRSLVVSIELIQRSVAVRIDGYDVEMI
jgi:transcription antitermination factor NusG